MSRDIRILLLADSHLGFDLPARARIARRRRGHDFLANYAAALEPALAGEVDIVVHGGDVFDRPGIAPSLAYQAFAPLVRVADRGVPVFVVPGNHERSRLPHERFASHPHVHVFKRPQTFVVEVHGITVALTGFPFERRDVRARFPQVLERSEWTRARAALRLLCVHQCVEGATVGPGDFTFTSAPDVIRVRDVPAAFAAVLAGHIHRHQVLTRDLQDRSLAAPVYYPGSIERTSLAEIGEPKGFMVVNVAGGGNGGGVRWEFRRLPARPMVMKALAADGLDSAALESAVRAVVAAAPPDAVLRIRIAGDVSGADLRVVSAARLRRFVPESMNIEIRAGDGTYRGPRSITHGRLEERARAGATVSADARRPVLRRRRADTDAQLDLEIG
jgi:DNA repair exonuclease SbcCD nuclease subunit